MTPFHVYFYGRGGGPLNSSFEEAAERLQQLPRLYLEPDGSFVVTRDRGTQRVTGMIYDAAGKIQYCELQGHCSHQLWLELRAALDGEPASDQRQLMRLPSQELQNLQSFEQALWPESAVADQASRNFSRDEKL